MNILLIFPAVYNPIDELHLPLSFILTTVLNAVQPLGCLCMPQKKKKKTINMQLFHCV